jgi:hypothetical protein
MRRNVIDSSSQRSGSSSTTNTVGFGIYPYCNVPTDLPWNAALGYGKRSGPNSAYLTFRQS